MNVNNLSILTFDNCIILTLMGKILYCYVCYYECMLIMYLGHNPSHNLNILRLCYDSKILYNKMLKEILYLDDLTLALLIVLYFYNVYLEKLFLLQFSLQFFLFFLKKPLQMLLNLQYLFYRIRYHFLIIMNYFYY